MTKQKDFKRRIRERQVRAGESYSRAREAVLGEQSAQLAPALSTPTRRDAVVLKVDDSSVRLRFLGEDEQVTVRTGDDWRAAPVVPGHVVTVALEKEPWVLRGHKYAAGDVENPRIDVAKLGLEPLPLTGGDRVDLLVSSEPVPRRDPYYPLWKNSVSKARPAFEFDGIAWGQLTGVEDADENPTCEAADLREAGREDLARKLLMDTLAIDLRVLDAHAGLGNMEFDRNTGLALAHYNVGVAIADCSFPAGFNGLLPWARLYNRAFLRCLHGQGLASWRLGQFAEAQDIFERLLAFNPTDNQGARFCWYDVRQGKTWEDSNSEDQAANGAMH